MLCISLSEFIRVAVGWIYCLAPGYRPRFIEVIVDEIIKGFKANCKSIGQDFFYYEIDASDVEAFVAGMLMPIQKFKDLNLSTAEFYSGVDVYDENRPAIVFTSRFGNIPEVDNFIDLDACLQNISSELRRCGK